MTTTNKSLVRKSESNVDVDKFKEMLAKASGVSVDALAHIWVKARGIPEANRLVNGMVRAYRRYNKELNLDVEPTLKDLMRPEHGLMIEALLYDHRKRENRWQPRYVHEELAEAMRELYNRKVMEIDWERNPNGYGAVQFALYNGEDSDNQVAALLREAIKAMHRYAPKGSRPVDLTIMWIGKSDAQREAEGVTPTPITAEERAADAAAEAAAKSVNESATT